MFQKRTGGVNAQVAKALQKMGVDPNHSENKMREERGKVDPRVNSVLEELGVRMKPEDIISEAGGTSPLDMPGEAPAVDPKAGQASGMQPQNKAGAPNGQNQGAKPPTNPEVKLKKPATSLNTLQDVSDKMTEVTANIKTVDLLIQALTENKASDNSIKTHKLTLRGPIQAVMNAVKDLAKLVE
jgi:hypothetical protein